MTPQELKNSILQLAIQGKLVEQRPEDGTAEELYQQIKEEKQRLIAEKKIKKEKPLPEITEDEKPFDIPDSWKWVRFSEVIDVRDGTHDTPKYTDKGIPLVTSKNLVNGNIDFDTAKLISKEDADIINMRSEVNTDDILFAMIGTIGNPVLVKKEREFCIKNMALFKPISPSFSYMKYIFIFLQKEQEIMKKNASGGVQSFVSLKFLRNYLLPLPPLAEQKRIVEKIEQILPHIDQYEKAWGKLETFNKRFPDDMKKSLLQYAIEGKLVEQRPEEGTAEELYQQIQEEKQRLIAEKKIKKEKPLPEITEDEIPFDIPDSWKWVRLRDICIKIVDGDHNPPSGVDFNTNFIMLSAQNINNDKIVNLDQVRYLTEDVFNIANQRTNVNIGDIFFTIVGTLGRSCVYNGGYNICFQRSVSVLQTLIYNYFLKYTLDTPFIQQFMIKNATGTAQKGFYLRQLEKLVIPLPPLAEQKRIVEKLEQMLPLCERLK